MQTHGGADETVGAARGETAHGPSTLSAHDATFRLMAEAMPQLVWSTTADGYHDYFNERWYAFTGMPRPDEPGGEGSVPQGWNWKDYLHPNDYERTLAVWQRSLAGGEPYEIEYRFRDGATGAYRWFLGRALPLRDPEGRIIRWFGTCTDIDAAKCTESALQVVAEAGVALGRSLDVDESLRAAARLIVPRLADWCAIDLVEPDGVVRRVAVEHADPAKVAFVHQLAARYPDRPDAPAGARAVLRTGRPELVPVIPDELLAATARDAEHLAIVRSLGLRSYLCVPIFDAVGEMATRAGGDAAAGDGAADGAGRVIGVLTLVVAEAGRALGARDLATAEDLARRIALAAERARIHTASLRDGERLREQTEELTVQNELLQQQALELEMQAAQLQEQATELEAQTDELQRTADALDQARARAEARGDQLDAVLRQAPAVMAIYSGPEHVVTYVNPTWERTLGKPGAVGRRFADVFPEMAGTGVFELLDRVHDTGEAYADPDLVTRIDRGSGPEETHWDIALQPSAPGAGGARDIIVHAVEMTPRVRAWREADAARARAEAIAAQLEEQAVATEQANEALQGANARLRAAEERIRLATEAAGLGTWDLDPTTGRLVWDDRCRAAFGLAPGAAVDYDTFLRYVHPDDRGRVERVVQAALDPSGSGRYETDFRTLGPDGVVRWVRAAGRATFGDVVARGTAARRATRFIGTVLDVSARVAADEALRESEARYRVLVEVLPQVVWGADAEGAITFVNQTFYDYSGFGPGEALGHAWVAAVHADDRGRVTAGWRRAVEGGLEYETEARLRRHDGSYRWFMLRSLPVRGDGGAVRQWIGTAVDIHERRASEEALREEAQLVDTLQRVGGALTSQLDLDALIQTVTDEATRLTGAQFGAFFYNRVDEAGESYMLYTLAGVDRDAFARFPMPRKTQVFAPTFDATSVVRSDDITADARYGLEAPYHGMPAGHLPVRSYLAVPVVSRSGEAVGGLFFGHVEPARFTERHERLVTGIAGWAAVAFDNARLYAAEHRARGEAEAARSAAEEANRAKSQFLATMSHELRTPLNAIAGYSELLLLGVRGPLRDEQREDVGRIKRSGQHLLSLINDILNFAKLEAGQVEYRMADAPLAPLLGGLEELVGPQVAAKGIAYGCRSCGEDVRVRVDVEKARQVLLNLLSNAVKFTAPGGRVDVSCDADAERVRVRVRDTGRGIPAEQLSRVFDPFVQVDRELTPASQQGIGLGLAISRDLARGMGGDLSVESAPGVGSTFTVTLARA